jgi:Na+/proline symporter
VIDAIDEAGNAIKITLGSHTGLYSLAIGFAVSLVLTIIVSLVTKKPSDEMDAEFEIMLKVEQ